MIRSENTRRKTQAVTKKLGRLAKGGGRVAKKGITKKVIAGGMGTVLGAGYIGMAVIQNAKDKFIKQQKETDKSIAMSNKLHNQWLKVKNAEKRKKRG